jgi:hypothetical protein
MKRMILTAAIAGLLGFVVGNAFFFLASPLWFDREISEPLPPDLALEEIATGSFRDIDRLHRGSGNATLLRTAGGTSLIRLSDFRVTNGPDLKLWLVEATNIAASADVMATRWVSLGALKGNVGDQTYILPDDVDLSSFGSVVVWCELFGVLFSAADLVAVAR